MHVDLKRLHQHEVWQLPREKDYRQNSIDCVSSLSRNFVPKAHVGRFNVSFDNWSTFVFKSLYIWLKDIHSKEWRVYEISLSKGSSLTSVTLIFLLAQSITSMESSIIWSLDTPFLFAVSKRVCNAMNSTLLLLPRDEE